MMRLKKFIKFSIAVSSAIILFISCEVICRTLHLSEKCEADFKFYIRQVANDVEHTYNKEDAILMWSPQPLAVHIDSWYNNTRVGIKINSKGLRDREYSLQKDNEKKRQYKRQVERKKRKGTHKLNLTANAKIIRDMMQNDRVKGNYRDFVIISGDRLIDWQGSCSIVRENKESSTM